MERLTTRDSDGTAITYEVDDICYYAVPVCQEIEIAGITMSRMDNFLKSIRGKVIDRLAQYEDTGLTPEEIHELTHDSYGPLHKKLGQWIDAEEHGRLVVLPEPTPDIDFMRIFNLIMADAEDRVIVLPCKVGDAVYLITDANKRYKPFIAEGYIESFRFHGGRKGQLKKKMYIHSSAEKDDDVVWCGGTFNQEAFGKTIFLTKEEAEAELKGGSNGSNV